MRSLLRSLLCRLLGHRDVNWLTVKYMQPLREFRWSEQGGEFCGEMTAPLPGSRIEIDKRGRRCARCGRVAWS